MLAQLRSRASHTPNNICSECLSRTCKHVCKLPSRLISQRMADMLILVAGGLSNQEIADRTLRSHKRNGREDPLLAESSVKTYLNEIKQRLGLSTRLEMALWARDNMALLKAKPSERGTAMALRTFRVFTNDRGRKEGVPMYSALCDMAAYTAGEAAGKVNPEFGGEELGPIVAIEWPATKPESIAWLAKHT